MSETKQYSLVFAKEASAELIRASCPGPCVRVTTRAEYMQAVIRYHPAVAFVDLDLLPQVDGVAPRIVIVGIFEDTRANAVRTLVAYPWLSHLIASALLPTPEAGAHLAALFERLADGPPQYPVGPGGVGRVALLGSSTRREARFERMREFMAARGVPMRAVMSCSDIAEELVTNALYDAPVEAGYFPSAVERTSGIELPPEHACEISYGMEDSTAFVRVRDPFGALKRARLLNVLKRCTSSGVALDESRGGAGLGLWRIFSTATTVDITVIPGNLTDILARVDLKRGRSVGKQLLAVHLFFPAEHAHDGTHGRFAADHDHDLMDDSFTAMFVA
ncbi:MAG TPA: hypothetical protein VNO30_19810 [Kofleriaceae bacterium]|nr:hypothetical protein [Kofleriaceae bacterium]